MISTPDTTEAEATIRDTDMAEEMVKYSNLQILQQAGQSMLAHCVDIIEFLFPFREEGKIAPFSGRIVERYLLLFFADIAGIVKVAHNSNLYFSVRKGPRPFRTDCYALMVGGVGLQA